MPNVKCVLAADNAMLGKQRTNGACTHTRSYFDNRLCRRRGRLNQIPVGKRKRNQHQDQNNYQKTSHKRDLGDWILHLDFMMRFSCLL